jgi:hypothetical protein
MEVSENTPLVEKPSFLKTLKKQIDMNGFASGIRSAIEIHGGRLTKIVNSEYTQDVIDNEPTMLLVTHNFSYEVIAAIGGLPDSNKVGRFRDVKLISEAPSETSWFDSYTIPLYNVDEGRRKLTQQISRMVNPKKELLKKEATFANFHSLMKASEFVADGGLVVMCPEGTRNKEDRWQKGVAALVKVTQRYLDQKNKNGYIIMCDVQGISLLDYIADKASNILPVRSPYKDVVLNYSQPIPITEIQTEGKSGEDISLQLENLYKHWIKENKSNESQHTK